MPERYGGRVFWVIRFLHALRIEPPRVPVQASVTLVEWAEILARKHKTADFDSAATVATGDSLPDARIQCRPPEEGEVRRRLRIICKPR